MIGISYHTYNQFKLKLYDKNEIKISKKIRGSLEKLGFENNELILSEIEIEDKINEICIELNKHKTIEEKKKTYINENNQH